jgi:hypothetical protein
MYIFNILLFFLEWEMLQIEVVEEIKTHILCSNTSFSKKSCCLQNNVRKIWYSQAGHR